MRKGLILDIILATLLCMILFFLASEALRPKSQALNPLNLLRSPYDFTDLYYTNFYRANKHDKSIALVNIQEANRSELATCIAKICAQSPKVLALDFVLSELRDQKSDSTLRAAINSCQTVVFSHFSDRAEDSFNPYFGNHESGHSQIITNESGKIVEVQLGDTKDKAFARVIAEQAGYLVRAKGEQSINPIGTHINFPHFELACVNENCKPYNFNQQIVMLGYAGKFWGDQLSLEDKHYFPLESQVAQLHAPKTPGVVIHANILSNILGNNFLKLSSTWVNFLMAAMLYALCCGFYFYHFERFSINFILKCRLFQVAMVSSLVFFVFLLFHTTRIKLNMTILVAAIITSFEFASIYIAILYRTNKRRAVHYSYILSKIINSMRST